MYINQLSDFGVLIIQARKAKKWSQTTLAEHAGLTQKSVSNIERGSDFTMTNCLKLCAVLSLKVKIGSVEEISHKEIDW